MLSTESHSASLTGSKPRAAVVNSTSCSSSSGNNLASGLPGACCDCCDAHDHGDDADDCRIFAVVCGCCFWLVLVVGRFQISTVPDFWRDTRDQVYQRPSQPDPFPVPPESLVSQIVVVAWFPLARRFPVRLSVRTSTGTAHDSTQQIRYASSSQWILLRLPTTTRK